MGGKKSGNKSTNQKKNILTGVARDNMGNTLKPRLEHAEKTGLCSLPKCQLKEFPPEIQVKKIDRSTSSGIYGREHIDSDPLN